MKAKDQEYENNCVLDQRYYSYSLQSKRINNQGNGKNVSKKEHSCQKNGFNDKMWKTSRKNYFY